MQIYIIKFESDGLEEQENKTKNCRNRKTKLNPQEGALLKACALLCS